MAELGVGIFENENGRLEETVYLIRSGMVRYKILVAGILNC